MANFIFSAVLLTDISKAFDFLSHKLLATKPIPYVVEMPSVKLTFNKKTLKY